MSPRRLLNMQFGLILTLTLASPAHAEDAGQSGKSVESSKAKSKCYKSELDKCRKSSEDAQSGLRSDLGKTLDKNKDETRNAVVATGQAQTATAAKYTAAASACQESADKCDQLCANEAKKDKSAIENCKKDFKELIDLIKGQATTTAQSGMEMSSAGNLMSSSGPSGTNAAGTTAADVKGGGGSGMGSAMGAMMPMAMMGAMMAKKQSDDDDKEEEKEQKRMLEQMQAQQQLALASNSAVQANGTVDCSKADAGAYSACNTYLVDACQQAMTNNTFGASPTCTNFAGRYCGTGSGGAYTVPYPNTGVGAGLATAAVTSGQPLTSMPTVGLSGEGRATNFCTSALAYNYCQVGGRLNCPSCQTLQSSTSAGCAQNPALCLGQTSAAVINQARTTCPDDPIFSNPAYTTGLVAAAPSTLPATTVVGAVTGGSTAILPSSVGALQTASLAGRTPAESAELNGPTSDITGRYGPSVFSTGTQAITKLCQTGQLNCP